MTTNALINLAAARIARGQRAWGRIKATAEEQRQLWFDVGLALLDLKDKANRPGKKFSEAVQGLFPGLDASNDVPAAIWFASEFRGAHEKLPVGMSHPKEIRRWWNEQQATQALPEDLKDAPAPRTRTTLEPRVGKRIVALHHRKESKGEGADIAASALTAYAKRYGITEEELVEAAAYAAPDEFFRFAPQMQKSIDNFRNAQKESIAQMVAAGVPPAAVRAIYINLANSI